MRGAAPLLALALLAGCATPAPIEPGWIGGRLYLRADADAERPAQSLSADFELRGDGDSGELRLNSPFGNRVATARWAPGLAQLSTAEGERHFAGLDALAEQALGEVLPLAALPDWLRGRPWPGAPSSAREAGFTQLGWTVLLARRAEGWIEARRDAPPLVQVRVRLDGDA